VGKKTRKRVLQKRGSARSLNENLTRASSPSRTLHGPSFSARDAWAALLIGLAVFVSYANTLDNDFVHDDRIEILQNTFIQDFSHLPQILTSPAWAFRSDSNEQLGSNYYRPVQYLAYAILYHLFGPNPWGYHLFKLLLHLAVCLLLFGIVGHYWESYSLGLVCALMFAVHPVNTEAVSWISGITDVTCAFFFLLTFLFYFKHKAHPSIATLLGFYVFFLVGLFAKESMATFIPVLFTYEWIHSKKLPTLISWKRVYLPLVIELSIYLAMRIFAIGSFTYSAQLRYDFLNGFQSFLNQMVLLSNYLKTFFFPLFLNAYHVFDPVLSLTDYRVGVAFTVMTIVLAIFWLIYGRTEPQQGRLMLFGLLWFILTLSPVLIFLKRIGENVFAERYLYLPSLGLCLSTSVPLQWLREKAPRVVNPVLVILLALSSWRVIDRNKIWKDELVFYEATARASPRAALILNNLGSVYGSKVRYQEALKAFEASASVRPNLAAYKNLGQIYAAVGRFADSITAYERAAAMSPGDASIYAGLGDLYFAQRRYPEAITAYKKSLSLNPQALRVCFNLADACVLEKRYDEARAAYEKVLSLSPNEAARAYRGLATVYTAQNLMDKAAAANQKALSVQRQ
jgi:protein O-mannosyl-transferase